MKPFNTLICITFIAILLITAGCKENTTDPVPGGSIQSSQDNALADGEFSTIFSFVDSQGQLTFSSIAPNDKNSKINVLSEEKSDLLPQCAVVKLDTPTKTLTIDFGTENCKCKDGLYRRGKIIAVFNGKYPELNSGVTVSLDNFYVEDMNVFGTKTIKLLGLHKVSIEVKNAGIVTPTKTIQWNCNRVIEKIWGQLTPRTSWDDEYTVSGSANGVNREGVAYTVNIDKALKKKVSCLLKDFVSGIITIQNDKGDVLSVDYDVNNDEGCNKLAKVTLNGKTQVITLR